MTTSFFKNISNFFYSTHMYSSLLLLRMDNIVHSSVSFTDSWFQHFLRGLTEEDVTTQINFMSGFAFSLSPLKTKTVKNSKLTWTLLMLWLPIHCQPHRKSGVMLNCWIVSIADGLLMVDIHHFIGASSCSSSCSHRWWRHQAARS